jgi:hypothetical protein
MTRLYELFEDREMSWGLFAVYHPDGSHRARQFGLDWDSVKNATRGRSQVMSDDWFKRILDEMRNLGWNIIPVETQGFSMMETHE